MSVCDKIGKTVKIHSVVAYATRDCGGAVKLVKCKVIEILEYLDYRNIHRGRIKLKSICGRHTYFARNNEKIIVLED